jgi:hypothetical protein
MINSNINQVMKAVTRYTDKIDLGVQAARDEMAMKMVQLSKEEIKGKRPSGERATPGEPPMNRTGNLRRSIKAEKYRKGFGVYSAVVGPTIVYGRSVEIAGKYAPRTWSGATKDKGFPYMEPAYKKFKQVAYAILRKHLNY